jgi:hypothetical protein
VPVPVRVPISIEVDPSDEVDPVSRRDLAVFERGADRFRRGDARRISRDRPGGEKSRDERGDRSADPDDEDSRRAAGETAEPRRTVKVST